MFLTVTLIVIQLTTVPLALVESPPEGHPHPYTGPTDPPLQDSHHLQEDTGYPHHHP